MFGTHGLRERITPWITNRTVNGYVIAVGAPFILLLLRISLQPLLSDSGPYLFFTPAVMVSAWYGGRGPGLVATVLGAALGDYYFLGPVGFDFESGSIARVILFLLVGGQISWLSGALRSAHTRLEARVRERTSELEFQKTLLEAQSNASLDGIMVVSDERNLIFHNRRLLELWNLPRRAFDSSLESAVMAMRSKLADDQDPLDQIAFEARNLSSELPPSIVLRDGKTLESYSADVRNSEGRSYGRVWYFRDVTERRRLAKQIIEAGESERQRIGLDLHDDLCPHLAGVACLGRVLHRHLEAHCPDEAPSAARIIELVEQAVRRARDLARGLQPLQMKPDALGAALTELAANIQSTFRVRCVCRLGEAPIILQDTAAAIQLYHIAQEAINNAIRHGKAAQILVELIRVGNSIVLSVEDNGVGIGTNPVAGLGFQTMRHRARLVGGSVTVEPIALGSGTCVRCRLPRAIRRARNPNLNPNSWSPMIDAPPERIAEAQKTRVLLVDDHVVLRQGLAVMIQDEPDLIVCGEADGVQSALDMARQTQPHIAVVDLSLKDGDGLELIKLLRNQAPDVQTLVLSMFDQSVYAERALHAGAHGYVMKSEPISNVLTGIRCVVRGERFLSPHLFGQTPHGSVGAAVEHNRPSRPGGGGLSRLSDRELQVLRRVGCGLSTREIADELFISVKTVETHREHLKQKLELADSGELLRYAIAYNRLGS